MAEWSQSRIDDLCSKFEEFRSLENNGPLAVTRFFETINLEAEPCLQLLSELIQIDVQMNWMQWDKSLEKRIKSFAPADVRHALHRLPRIGDYKTLIPGHFGKEGIEAFAQLAKCEMEFRNRWGDAIGSFHYQAEYGLNLSPVSGCDGIVLKCARVGARPEEDAIAFTVRGKTLIGRQRSTDRLSQFEEQLPEGNRIVISDRMDATISREQLSVEVLNRRFAIVTNLSSVNPVQVANVEFLEPGGTRVMKFDFSIVLPGVRLLFTSGNR